MSLYVVCHINLTLPLEVPSYLARLEKRCTVWVTHYHTANGRPLPWLLLLLFILSLLCVLLQLILA